MRYDADPSRDTMATLRSLDSLSSRLTMRSKTCGGGPSIDSNATVAPPPADANALPAGPPLAHPPSAHSNASSTAARKARGAAGPAMRSSNNISFDVPVTSSDTVKSRQGLGQDSHSRLEKR